LNARISFYLDLVSEGRTKGHEPQAYLREDGDIWQRYEALLRREGLLDFDSMLVVFRTLLESHADVRARFHRRYTHLVVDEFQDNSGLQTRLLQLMVCAEAPQLTVVGDDDQCIYQFRGAEPGNFARLPADFQALTLVDNYRSSANVLAVPGPNPSLKPEPEPEPKPNPQPQPQSQP